MTDQEYIDWLAPRVVLDSLDRNLLPSFRISQGCFEAAYGTSDLAVYAKNLFGVKVNDQWEDSIYWQGWYLENRSVSRKYHPEIKHYAELIGNRDYKDCARILQEKNYGTSPEYAQRVIDYVEKHHLTQYDSMTREEAEEIIRKERERMAMRINVHAGHNPDGKIAYGAIGFLKESTENRNVKNEVIRLLRALGHTVYDCTVDNGTSSKNILESIVKKCNANEVDLDVSIHFNSTEGTLPNEGKTTGTEVFVYKQGSKAEPYAKSVCSAIADLGFYNRGVKYSDSLYVLKNTAAPAMLIECCFVNDKDDATLYDHESMAEAIVYGITGQKYAEREESNIHYRVQVGYYAYKENAEAMMGRLKAAGFDAILIKA